jgi:hypothetical protein
MAIDPTVIGVSLGGMGLLFIVLLLTGSTFFSIIVVLILIGGLLYVLNSMGVISITTTDNQLDVKFLETPPAPSDSKKLLTTGIPLHKKEVFYVSGNQYTYDDAPAVCAAYEAELATYDQVMEAYSGGAEWCGYGWTSGGMALFPTQQSTWNTLMQESDQTKRTQCGRPGINGGYFDPSTKFGVNCYGVKPSDKGTTYPLPTPGTDTNQFNQLVQKFKSMVHTMSVSPFNRDGWSEWSIGSHIPQVNTPKVNK